MAFESPLDPIKPNRPLSRRQLDKAMRRINDSLDVGISGGQTSDEFGQRLFNIPTETRVQIRITGGGTDGLYDAEEVALESDNETWEATGARSWDSTTYPAVERNGKTDVPTDTICEGLIDEATGRVTFTAPASNPVADEFFPVNVTVRSLRNGIYTYAFREQTYLRDGSLEDADPARSGTVGATIEVEVIAAGSTTTNAIQTVTIGGATGGTFSLSIGGTSTGAIPWDASPGQIQTILATAGIVGVSVSGAFTFTWDDVGAQSPITDTNNLLPLPEHPLYELNNLAVEVPTVEFVRIGYDSEPLEISQTESGDGIATNAVHELYVDAVNGTYTLSYDGEETDPLDWDASASEIEAALNGLGGGIAVTVTGTGDREALDPFVITSDDPAFADHTIEATDVDLVSARTYSFRGQPEPETDACGNTLTDPTTITGYDAEADQVLIHDTDGCLSWEDVDEC